MKKFKDEGGQLMYCPLTGSFAYGGQMKKKGVCKVIGGYYWITGYRMNEPAHRAAFHLMGDERLTRDMVVDHINGNKLDNRWFNLRAVTHTVNSRNTGLQKNNKSGITGVRWNGKRWSVVISGGKTRTFSTLLDAAAYRRSMEVKLGYRRQK